jgi:decaprenylphospho-beta-D-erythro-pentofuranosid-2-ulose 2-reductase
VGEVQSVLVLGAGSDIARATLSRLVEGRTRSVVLAGRHPDEYEADAKVLRKAGATVETMAFDALDVADHQRVVAAAAEVLGDIDLVLVAFGVLGDQDVFDRDPAAGADAVSVNLTGAVSVGLAAATRLRAQGHGTLVLLSSVAGQRARRANPVYGASKAGADAFYQGLGDRLTAEGSGVRVVIVRPGFVRTKMTAGTKEAPFAVDADDVAEGIVRGLQTSADVVWVPPFLKWVFMVFRHLPRSVWRRLPF